MRMQNVGRTHGSAPTATILDITSLTTENSYGTKKRCQIVHKSRRIKMFDNLAIHLDLLSSNGCRISFHIIINGVTLYAKTKIKNDKEADLMKKKYEKPTMKLVEWNFQDPICNTVYQHSPCIVIEGVEGANTRHDTRMDWVDENVTWHNFN